MPRSIASGSTPTIGSSTWVAVSARLSSMPPPSGRKLPGSIRARRWWSAPAERVPQAEVRLGSAESIPFEDDRFTAASGCGHLSPLGRRGGGLEGGATGACVGRAPAHRRAEAEAELRPRPRPRRCRVAGAASRKPWVSPRLRSRPSRSVDRSIWPCPRSNRELLGLISARRRRPPPWCGARCRRDARVVSRASRASIPRPRC